MKCLTPYYVRAPSVWKGVGFNWLPVPCGRCALCCANRRREWTFRLSEEMLTADYTAFATLTYDEQHLPVTDTDELSDIPTLKYEDVQLFLKRFRKRLSQLSINLRYFICGEYGSNTYRPHYHCMFFFRSDIPNNVINNCVLFPKLFRDSWTLGNITDFQQAKSNGSLGYCSKYVNKFFDVKLLETQAVEKSLKSQLIGRDYITRMKKWHLEDPENRKYANFDGYKISLPRTFRQKIFETSKDKKSVEEIEKIYRDMVDLETQRINKLKAQHYDTYKTLDNFPDIHLFQPSTPQEIKDINDYVKRMQHKDKF